MLTHNRSNLLTRRNVQYLPAQILLVHRQPRNTAPALGHFQEARCVIAAFLAIAHFHSVPFLEYERRDVGLASVDQNVSVEYELPGSAPRRRETEPVDNVIHD